MDELILLPLAIAGIMRLLGPAIMEEHRATAATLQERPRSNTAAMVIITIWLIAAVGFGSLVWHLLLP